MDVNALINQGMSAMKAGDRETARDVLEQAVAQDPDNAKAWYMLAGAYTDTEDRRYALEKVLEIMPDNEQAQAQLAKLPQPAVATVDPDPVAEPVSDPVDPAPVTPDPEPMNTMNTMNEPTSSPAGEGFDLPVDIPGKPDTITPQGIVETFIEILKNSIAILQQKPGAYAQEVQHASWWRFWVFLGGATLITAIATTISGFIVQSQISGMFAEAGVPYSSPGIFNILIGFIVAIPIGIAVMYASVYASHKFVTNNRDGQGSLVTHAYAIILPLTATSLIGNLIGLVFSVLPFGGLIGIVTFAIAIYGWYIAYQGIKMVHKVEGSAATWTMVVLIVVQIATAFILGLILSPLLLAGAMSFL